MNIPHAAMVAIFAIFTAELLVVSDDHRLPPVALLLHLATADLLTGTCFLNRKNFLTKACCAYEPYLKAFFIMCSKRSSSLKVPV